MIGTLVELRFGNVKKITMKFNMRTSLILSAMKNLIMIIAVLLLCSLAGAGSDSRPAGEMPQTDQYITVACSPDLVPLAREWVNEYNQSGEGMKVSLVEASEKAEELLATGAAIGFMSEAYLGNADQGLQKMVIARNVVVPVMNSSNPYHNEIFRTGIKREDLSHVCSVTSAQDWSKLLGDTEHHPMHIYILDEPALQGSLSEFLNPGAAGIAATVVGDVSEMIAAIKQDPYAIGFCHLTDIIDPVSFDFVQGIGIMPIDKNGNGQLEYFEDIYAKPELFSRSLWVGKYPRELIGGIYLVSAGNSLSGEAAAFMKWTLTAGQDVLGAYGYSDLALGEVRSNLDRLVTQQPVLEPHQASYAGLKIILMLVVVSILVGIILESVVLFRRYSKDSERKEIGPSGRVFREDGIHAPKGLFFDKTHTWAFMQSDGKVRIGLDDFMARLTGPLTGIRMKNPGEPVKKGEVILSIIQKGKQLNIKAPVSGVILENNQRLMHDASVINSDPYSGGWIYMIEPSNWLREIQLMFMADRFRSWLKGEFTRLKDFFAMAENNKELQFARVVYQEGGELKEGVLGDLDPEVWEDFQSHFIETTA
jgi:glycine cleavage system H lipoate-binding protein/ABC-type phosphate transport system substrate-binding protein